jgi:hypothetical protein
MLTEANNAALRQEWNSRFISKKTNKDQLIVKTVNKPPPAAPKGTPDEIVLNSVPVTIGDVDETGKTIEVTTPAGVKQYPIEKIHGMIFQREPDPAAAPLLCKVYDIHANVIFASALTVNGDKLSAATPNGVKLEMPRAALARLDYTKGKLSYLSDWDEKDPKLMRYTETSAGGIAEHFRRDKNLDDGPIRLESVPYAKGLAVHARTDLIYELNGEYREFKAIIGVDDLVGGSEGPTIVQIEDVSGGAAKELHKPFEISRKTKPEEVTINVQNVKSLRIRVSSPELLDLGHHVDLAEARVTK